MALSFIRRHRIALAFTALAIAATAGIAIATRATNRIDHQNDQQHADSIHRDLQLRLAVFTLCRSDGRTRNDCRRIANGVVLPVLTHAQEKKIVTILGKVGPAGALGPHGVQGLVGKAGIHGPRGETGPQGLPGARGAQGATGVQGKRGVQGQRGSPGAVGPPGPAGPAGPSGAPCNLIIATITIPSQGTFQIPVCSTPKSRPGKH